MLNYVEQIIGIMEWEKWLLFLASWTSFKIVSCKSLFSILRLFTIIETSLSWSNDKLLIYSEHLQYVWGLRIVLMSTIWPSPHTCEVDVIFPPILQMRKLKWGWLILPQSSGEFLFAFAVVGLQWREPGTARVAFCEESLDLSPGFLPTSLCRQDLGQVA